MLSLVFHITYKIINKYYPGESVNVHIQSLINIIQENNWASTAKKRVRVNYHYLMVTENR